MPDPDPARAPDPRPATTGGTALREDLRDFGRALRGVRADSWILLGLVLGLLLGWAWLSPHYPRAVLPTPRDTGDALVLMLMDARREFPRALGNTMAVYYIGFFAAVLLGWGLNAVMVLAPLPGRLLRVLLDALGAIPNIAFIPLLVVFLGLGAEAKAVIVLLAVLIPVAISGHAALLSVDKVHDEAARGLGANALQSLIAVRWPLALPQMVAGLRIAAAQGLLACVVAEIYTAMTGLGGLLVGYGSAFNMARYFVVVIAIALIGLVTTAVLRRIEARLLRHRPDRGSTP